MLDFSDSIMYLRYYKKKAYLNILFLGKGLDYTGRIESHNSSFRGYEGCYPINLLLKRFHISNRDNYLDIGCGKGLSMYYASKFGFDRIDGLDYSRHLTHIATQNAKILNDKRFHIYNCDARYFEHYDEYNFFFINNPFSAEIMEQVVCSLIKSYYNKKRRIVVLYQFPFSINVFTKHGFRIIYDKMPNSILTFDENYDKI